MSDLTPMLQEMAERADPNEMLVPHEIRRAGERRKQRLVMATASCVVLGAIAAGLVVSLATKNPTSVGPIDRPEPTTTPTPAPTPTPPDDRIGIIGPPLPGTPPTGPDTGELVAAAETYNTGSWVYADGRLINAARNYGTSDEYRGIVVRRLTPSGVEAIRQFLLEGTNRYSGPSETFEHLRVREGGRLVNVQPFAACGLALTEASSALSKSARRVCPPLEHPETWLPADAWEDPTYRPFIPATFRVCLDQPDASVLPATAADILLASPTRSGWGDCRAVTTSDARIIADALEAAGAVSEGGNNLAFNLGNLRSKGHLVFAAILPDGGWFCDCG
jgi:hypothetical protein